MFSGDLAMGGDFFGFTDTAFEEFVRALSVEIFARA